MLPKRIWNQLVLREPLWHGYVTDGPILHYKQLRNQAACAIFYSEFYLLRTVIRRKPICTNGGEAVKITVLNVGPDGTQTLLEKEVPEDFFEISSVPLQEEAPEE